MEAYGHQRSLSLTKFGKDYPKVMKEFGAEYKKARTDKGFRYNMDLSDTASDWLPALALPHHPQPEEPPHSLFLTSGLFRVFRRAEVRVSEGCGGDLVD